MFKKKSLVNTKIQFKEKQDSKKDKRELEGEKYLETKLSNVQEFEKPAEFIQKK